MISDVCVTCRSFKNFPEFVTFFVNIWYLQLTLEQKETRMDISGDLIDMADKVNKLPNNITTKDEI